MYIGFIRFRAFLGLGVARRSKAKAVCFLSPDQTPRRVEPACNKPLDKP